MTAASSGLGRACAAALAAEGARVVVSSRGGDRLATAAAETGAAGHLPADLTSPVEASALVSGTVELLGGLDVLVVNCGPPPAGTFADLGDADWAAAHEGVLMSAVRAALPHLRACGRGRVVFLTGYGTREPTGGLVASEARQGGAESMYRAYLGSTPTPPRAAWARSPRAWASGPRPLGRPEDVGDLCAFLCSRARGSSPDRPPSSTAASTGRSET